MEALKLICELRNKGSTQKKRYSYAGIQPMYLYVTVYLSNIHKKKVNRKK